MKPDQVPAPRPERVRVSFVNLMANAPAVAMDYSISNPFYTPICDEIGGPGMAIYRFGGRPREGRDRRPYLLH